MPLNRRIDKENVTHLHNEVLLNGKKKNNNNDILKFAGKWMDLGKKNILTEVTQTQKDIYHMYSLISGFCR